MMFPQVLFDGMVPLLDESAIEAGMEAIQAIMERSIRTTIVVQGRPPWPPRKNDVSGPLLGGTEGMIYRSVRGEHGPDWAMVAAVATIHQTGGVIRHPGVGYAMIGVRTKSGKLKMQPVPNPSGRKLMVFVANGKLVFTYSVKPHLINIPRRQYFVLQEEDIEDIRSQVPNSIIGGISYEPVATSTD